MKSFLYMTALAVFPLTFAACQNSPEVTKGGIKYIYRTKNEGVKAKIGDVITLNRYIYAKCKGKDSLLNQQPFTYAFMEPMYNGDLQELFPLMAQGDSLTAFVHVDSVFRQQPRPDFIDAKSEFRCELKMQKIQTKEDAEKERQAALSKQANIDEELIKQYLTTNKINAQRTETGLYYIVTKEGNGRTPQQGDNLEVHYTGSLLNGEKFDSSLDRNQTLPFVHKAGQMIKGFDEGMAFVKQGGKITLFLPSGLAYGDQSPSPKIPANSILKFEVELVAVKTQEEAQKAAEAARLKQDEDAKKQKVTDDNLIKKHLAEKGIKNAQRTASGLYYQIIEAGTGAAPKQGDNVEVHYTGTLLNGTKFDSSRDRGQTLPFAYQSGQMIQGFDEGVGFIKQGGKIKLFIPSHIGYGANSPSPSIPANAVLCFDVELVKVGK